MLEKDRIFGRSRSVLQFMFDSAAVVLARRDQESLYLLEFIRMYNFIEGSLEAKLPTIWKDGNGTARKKLGRGES